MIAWARQLGKRVARAWALTSTDPALLSMLGADSESVSGTNVTADNAMRISAVWACVRVISEAVASLPLQVFERTRDGRDLARDNPLYPVLHDLTAPSLGLTSLMFRETMQAWLLLYGNAYALIHRDGIGQVVELWPIHPGAVTIRRKGTETFYVVQYDDGPKSYAADKVMHIKALAITSSGLYGLSPVAYARESMGLSLAHEEHGARFYANGADFQRVIEYEGSFKDDEQAVSYAETFKRRYGGLSNSSKTPILEFGMHVKNNGLSMEDAQFIDSRHFQVEEIARLFLVPLHMIQEMKGATFSNIEHQAIAWVTNTLRPWLVR